MTKPSNVWSRLAASSLLFVSSAAFAAVTPSPIDPLALQSAKDTAALSGAAASGQYGSRAALKTNLVEPTTSAVPMKTIDGLTSFDAQLSFPSTRTFLELFVQPSATGDLSTVIAGQDLNLDGTIDASYQVPVQVSGICANGLISCSPGTWTGCSYYSWAASVEGRLSLTDTSLLKLGGCYCINTSCGSDLTWSNLSFILKDLGGGAVGAIQATNPSFSISNVAISGTTIFYSGQALSLPQGENGSPSLNSPTPPSQLAYYNTPMSIIGDAQLLATSQAGDPDSLYSLVTGIDPNHERIPCEMKRNIVMTAPNIHDVISPIGGTGTIQFCGTDCLEIILGKAGINYWSGNCTIYTRDYTVDILRPEMIGSAKIVTANFDDFVQTSIDGSIVYRWPAKSFPPEVGGCYDAGESYRNPNTDVTSFFQHTGKVETKMRVSVASKGSGLTVIRIKLKPSTCTSSEEIQDECSTLEGRPDCQLQLEEIDGVATVMNFNPTGLSALPSTKIFSSNSYPCNDIYETRNWWQIKRSYMCGTNPYDNNDALKRFGMVQQSLADDGTNVTYLDSLKSTTGEWSDTAVTLSKPQIDQGASCELACKTRKAKVDSQANLLGTSSQYQADTQSYDIIYRTCDNNGLCPSESGEEIIKECQCLNEFNEAASMMQMLRLGGQDAICTTGEEKALK